MDPLTVALLASASAPVIGGLLGGNKKTSQVPLETPEQKVARQRLLDFATTGTFGKFSAGAQLPLEYGDFSATDPERLGLSSLQSLLSSGIPGQFRLGDEALRDILATSPQQIESQFAPFQAQVRRQTGEASRDLKRQAGFARNLYSTKTIQGLGDVQARGNETLTAQLAALTDQALSRRLQAIPLAYQSGEAQEALRLGRIGASQQYGGLTRQLNTAAMQARDAEILRRRQELQLPIQAAQTVSGASAPFGVPSVETSPLQGLLGLAGQIGGQYLGNELMLRQYGRYFPSGGGYGAPAAVQQGSRMGLPSSLSLFQGYGA